MHLRTVTTKVEECPSSYLSWSKPLPGRGRWVSASQTLWLQVFFAAPLSSSEGDFQVLLLTLARSSLVNLVSFKDFP